MAINPLPSSLRTEQWSMYLWVSDANDMRRRVGARIRRARLAKGLPQSALARALPGRTEARDVSRWERGRNMPSWPALHAIAQALDVTVAWLLTEDDDDEPEERAA